MDESERQDYKSQCAQLRIDLKRFEGDWAKQNGGTKPGREDIKKNPDIARKYKKYNEARDILSGKLPPPSRKRKPEHNLAQTPSKRSKQAQTPSKTRHYDVDTHEFETPSAQRLFSPAMPTSIGPTPQRDGRILGLFDLLLENDENARPEDQLDSAETNTKIQATPSKKPTAEDDEVKLGRTPMSTSKRAMLDTFMTPHRRRDGLSVGGKTPSSVRKLQFQTPSFLRRAPLPSVDQHGHYLSPEPLRLPRKPLGRSLSSVIASLRKVEEEALDDDLEALREMEDETNVPVKPSQPVKQKDEVLEPDSQGPQLLGGFDDEGLYDSPTEEGGRDQRGQPLKVYKKKGQKRTTRKVNMKPTRTRRAANTNGAADGSETEAVVPETQVDPSKLCDDDEEPLNLNSDSEFEVPTKGDGGKGKSEAKKSGNDSKKPSRVQKAAKKVNELAHANFKRLKLKNHGAKGGPGFGSKFRRRR